MADEFVPLVQGPDMHNQSNAPQKVFMIGMSGELHKKPHRYMETYYHERRVNELLEANNKLVEEVRDLKRLIGKYRRIES